MTFPIIHDDLQMRQAVADREEIRFMKQSNGTTVCSYIIASAETFRDSYACEARGIVFDADGNIIARPLHKFFNVNERLETQAHSLDWRKVTRVMLKRDGSMIHTVAQRNTDASWPVSWCFDLKSKKSFTSDVALAAKRFLFRDQSENGVSKYAALCNFLVEHGKTAVFEWTSPTARIVVGYKQDELQLLHVRDNITGEYFHQFELEALCKDFDIPLVESQDLGDPSLLIEQASAVEEIEGWVIQFESGAMVKLKTKWYMDRHHAMTFLRTRDIARMVVDETLDDLKAKLVGDGIDITQINDIENRVVREIDYIIERVEMAFEANKALDRKNFAILMTGHKYFNLLMQKFSGKEPDYKGYFEKRHLDEMFDLTQLNLTDSVAEVE